MLSVHLGPSSVLPASHQPKSQIVSPEGGPHPERGLGWGRGVTAAGTGPGWETAARGPTKLLRMPGPALRGETLVLPHPRLW